MKKIAVLLSGGVNSGSNYSRYINDLREMYRALVDKYGYSKSNIFVLYADGSANDLDGDGNNDIHSGCSLTELNTLFQTTLPAKINNNDFLFVFSTNHGGLTDASTSRAKLWLWGGSIEDSAFASLVNGLSFKYLAVCMEQCYAGGFINDLAGNNRVIATACQHDEVSWACDSEGNYDEFCYYWTAAVRGKKPGGQAVSADMDGDGFLSLHDAFEYAKANDSRNEHPQYYESPAGLGSRLGLSGSKQVVPVCHPSGSRPVFCRPGSPIPRPQCRPGSPIPRPQCRPGSPI
ncbi:MAG: C13 family peptidase, partial [Thermodesulfobacteriota bacterium]|nr:C13 family peptidase [Thermodesulfobacteriota bacterium]